MASSSWWLIRRRMPSVGSRLGYLAVSSIIPRKFSCAIRSASVVSAKRAAYLQIADWDTCVPLDTHLICRCGFFTAKSPHRHRMRGLTLFDFVGQRNAHIFDAAADDLCRDIRACFGKVREIRTAGCAAHVIQLDSAILSVVEVGSHCREKACNLGGALGRVIQVGSFDELKAACTSSEACTIVITKNISKTGSYTKDGNGRYRFADAKIYVNPNKTIIGSYSAHSLYNVFFQTFGENYGPGHDLIFRNIEISHDKELNSDNIWEFAYGSNYWIDHITFVGHDKVNGASTKTDDWDKFLNFKGNTDFITISDCKFGLHEYGVLLGYPTDDQATYDQYNGHPCVTLANNYYRDCITRAPGLMRYGYFHSLNNYVVNFDMGYTIYTACKLYSESNYFDAGTGKGSVVNDTVSANDISSKYKGAYTDSGSKLVNSRYSLSGKTASACTWRPGTNYTYTAFSADQSKNYCT